MRLFVRNAIQILLIGALLFLAACELKPASKGPWIVGSWRGTFYGYNVLLTFGEDGSFVMYTQGAFVKGTYTIDTTVTPNLLDISIEGANPVLTIVLFTDENTFKFENNLPTVPRPETFSDFVIFTRNTKENAPGTPHPAPTYTPASTP